MLDCDKNYPFADYECCANEKNNIMILSAISSLQIKYEELDKELSAFKVKDVIIDF